MNKREIKKQLHGIINGGMEKVESFDSMDDDNFIMSEYIGSFMSLDPCGRYHHILSPNGATAKCIRFWDNLNDAANELGGWIEGGEGDPTDIFFRMSVEQYQTYHKKEVIK